MFIASTRELHPKDMVLAVNPKALPRAVSRELISRGKRGYTLLIATNIAVSTYIVFLTWSYTDPALAISWAASLVGIVVARSYVLWAAQPEHEPSHLVRSRIRSLRYLAIAYGCVVGLPIPFWLDSLPHEEQLVFIMIVGFWTAALTVSTSMIPGNFYGSVVPILLPLFVYLLIFSSLILSPVLAALVAMFFLVERRFYSHGYSLFVESIRLRRKNSILVRRLAREKEHAEVARAAAEEASQTRSLFFASASHDLRQPLTAIQFFVDAIARETDPDRVRRLARKISGGIESLGSLLNSLLDLSRLEAGVVKPVMRVVPVGELVRSLGEQWRPSIEGKGLQLRLSTVDARMRTDPNELTRIISNLMENAVRYTHKGWISLSVRTLGREALVIEVADTGIGIAAEEQRRVFDDFYQVSNPARDRSRGLGMGLGIVRRLAQLLGLSLQLDSQLGRGSVFRLSGAQCHTDSSASGLFPLPALSAAPLAGLTVLVIEDDLEVKEALSMLLSLMGLRILEASTGIEADRIIERTRPDVILADYRLRDGENGVKLVQLLLAKYGAIPSVVLSGDTAPERLKEADSAGFPMLHKPIDANQLETALAALVTRNQVQRSG